MSDKLKFYPKLQKYFQSSTKIKKSFEFRSFFEQRIAALLWYKFDRTEDNFGEVPENNEFFPEDIRSENVIGTGGYGTVSDARSVMDGVVVKWFQATEADQCVAIAEEAKLLCKLQHKHIVDGLGYFGFKASDSEIVAILMPKYERGSLKKWLTNPKIAYSMYTVVCWMYEMFAALEYLKKQHVYHRDVKPDNVLLNDDWEVSLGDFGASKVRQNVASGSFVGTERYRCPEVLFPNEEFTITHASDVYSMGYVFWEMIERRIVFCKFDGPESFDLPALEEELNKRDIEKSEHLAMQCPEQVEQIIYSCLQFTPETRIDSEIGVQRCFQLKQKYEEHMEYIFKPNIQESRTVIFRPKGFDERQKDVEIRNDENDDDLWNFADEYTVKNRKKNANDERSDSETSNSFSPITHPRCTDILDRHPIVSLLKIGSITHEEKSVFNFSSLNQLFADDKEIEFSKKSKIEHLEMISATRDKSLSLEAESPSNLVKIVLKGLPIIEWRDRDGLNQFVFMQTLDIENDAFLYFFQTMANLKQDTLSYNSIRALSHVYCIFFQIFLQLKIPRRWRFKCYKDKENEWFLIGRILGKEKTYFVRKDFTDIMAFEGEWLSGKEFCNKAEGKVNRMLFSKHESVNLEDLYSIFLDLKENVQEKLIFNSQQKHFLPAPEGYVFNLHVSPAPDCRCEDAECPLHMKGFYWAKSELQHKFPHCSHPKQVDYWMLYVAFSEWLMQRQQIDDPLDLIWFIAKTAILRRLLSAITCASSFDFYQMEGPVGRLLVLSESLLEDQQKIDVKVMNETFQITSFQITKQEINRSNLFKLNLTQVTSQVAIDKIIDKFFAEYYSQKESSTECSFFKFLGVPESEISKILPFFKRNCLKFIEEDVFQMKFSGASDVFNSKLVCVIEFYRTICKEIKNFHLKLDPKEVDSFFQKATVSTSNLMDSNQIGKASSEQKLSSALPEIASKSASCESFTSEQSVKSGQSELSLSETIRQLSFQISELSFKQDECLKQNRQLKTRLSNIESINKRIEKSFVNQEREDTQSEERVLVSIEGLPELDNFQKDDQNFLLNEIAKPLGQPLIGLLRPEKIFRLEKSCSSRELNSRHVIVMEFKSPVEAFHFMKLFNTSRNRMENRVAICCDLDGCLNTKRPILKEKGLRKHQNN